MTTAKVSTQSAGADFSSYLTVKPDSGEIRTPDGQRVAIVTGGFLRSLIDAVKDKVGGEIGEVLYGAGRRWGTEVFALFRAEPDHGGHLLYHPRNMNLSFFKTKFNEVLSHYGWGTFDIYEKYELIFVELHRSGYAEMVGCEEPGFRTLFAGFFAGFFTDLIAVELDCIELVPSAPDEGRRVYLLSDSCITEGVRGWLEKGKTYEEILTCLENKEYSANASSSP